MIAVIEDQHLGPLGDHARHAQGEAVGIGGGEGKLPVGQTKAALQLLPHPDDILIGQHQRDPFADLLLDGFDRGIRTVTGHGAGIAEAEVDVGIAVHVGEVGAFGFLHKDRERARPADHPQHRHAAMQRLAGALVELVGFGVVLMEELFFLLEQLGEFGAIECRHGV